MPTKIFFFCQKQIFSEKKNYFWEEKIEFSKNEWFCVQVGTLNKEISFQGNSKFFSNKKEKISQKKITAVFFHAKISKNFTYKNLRYSSALKN